MPAETQTSVSWDLSPAGHSARREVRDGSDVRFRALGTATRAAEYRCEVFELRNGSIECTLRYLTSEKRGALVPEKSLPGVRVAVIEAYEELRKEDRAARRARVLELQGYRAGFLALVAAIPALYAGEARFFDSEKARQEAAAEIEERAACRYHLGGDCASLWAELEKINSAAIREQESPAFVITDMRYRFADARDCIDATSAFEASTLDECAYEIAPSGDGWTVEVYTTSPRGYRGNLAPADFTGYTS